MFVNKCIKMKNTRVTFRFINKLSIVLVLLFLINSTNVWAQKERFSIKGKVVACSCKAAEPGGYIYLYKNSIAIDSTFTNRYISSLGWWFTIRKFNFRGVENGEYEIRYNSAYDTQDYPIIEINNKNVKKIKICFDLLPERLYSKNTMLDNLSNNDTLHINVYIASFGEFGGYDESLWITKVDNQYYGRFYSLPNTYRESGDSLAILKAYFDKNKQSMARPKTDSFILNQLTITTINRFLIEIEHYKKRGISGNAPEHILIYTKNQAIFRFKSNARYAYPSYFDLRAEILKSTEIIFYGNNILKR